MDGASRAKELHEAELEFYEFTLDNLKIQGFPGKTHRPVFLKTVFLEVIVEQIRKLDTSAWTTADGLALSRLPMDDAVEPVPTSKLRCPKDWLPAEPRELDSTYCVDVANTKGTARYLMPEKFNGSLISTQAVSSNRIC
ncbi:unnamed protein product [Orchesella dallaii]|uniref:Uncharacterized protein n=1 Tax=Orchesella dallaii TaxID=48710 RepID=A0ABP1PN12_9HEXA